MVGPQPVFFVGSNETDFLVWDSCFVAGTYYYFLISVVKAELTIQDLTEIKNVPREIVSRLMDMQGVLVDDLSGLIKTHPKLFLSVFSLSPTLGMRIVSNGSYFVSLVRGSKFAEIINGEARGVSGKLQPQDYLLFAKQNLPLDSTLIEKMVASRGLVNEVLAELSGQSESGILSLYFPEGFLETTPENTGFPTGSGMTGVNFSSPVIPAPIVIPAKAGTHTNFKVKIVNTLDWLISKLNKKEIFIGSYSQVEETGKKKPSLYLVGVILVVLFLVSVVFGSISQKTKKEKEGVQTTLLQITQLLGESETVSGTDMARARELYAEAKNLLNAIPPKYTTDVKGAQEQLAILQKTVTREYGVQLTNYIDLDLVEENFNPDLACFSAGKLYLARKTLGAGVIFDLETKKKELEFKYNDLNNAQKLFCYGDKLFLATKTNILFFDKGVFREVLTLDRDGFVFAAFGTNLYAVDAPNSLIYRYPGTASGYGERSLWLTPNQELDLSDTVMLNIDGSLWVGGLDGNVLKFTQGRIDPFKNEARMEGSTVSNLIVDENLLSVYVFDAKTGTLNISDKKGVLLAVYKSDELKSKILVGVSETNKKAIFQDGSQLLSLEFIH